MFDTAGNHLLPATLRDTEICATVRDYLKNGTLQQEIIQFLRNSQEVREQAPAAVPVPAAIENPAPPVRLSLTRGLVNLTLGSGLLATAQGNEFPKASIFLDAGALSAIRAAPQPVDRILSLSVDHIYRAQFVNFDLTVNLHTAESSLAQMVGSLRPIPAGRPTYLLSSSLPTMLPGGGVDRDVQFISQVRSATSIQVLQRVGSQVSPAMVDRMLDTALNQANLAVQISAVERQHAIASILLDDGLAITLPLGHINEIASDMRTDSTRQWSDALETVATKNQDTQVHVSGDVDGGLFTGGAGGSWDVETRQRWARTDYRNQKREDFAHQLEDLSARLTGDIPVVTGLHFTDAGTVLNVNIRNLEQSIGQFTTGLADYPAVRSLKEDADLQTQARQVEVFLVPQFEVGGAGVVGYAEAIQRPGEWAITRTNIIRFSKPFASPPQVAVALNVVNWSSGSETLLYARAENITAEEFTAVFQTHPATPIYWMAASWTAIGQRRLDAGSNGGLAGLGNIPGGLVMIPAEARLAARTPELQSAPQFVDGRFRASFNGIPDRHYKIEASTDLADWSPVGGATAEDFLVNFELADSAAWSHRFFRVSTP